MSKFMDLNPHSVGIVMKELVRRAIETIRNVQFTFEVTNKVGYTGKMDDMFTSADKAAQTVYLRSLRECFPKYGIVAEEDYFRIGARNPAGLFFTVDPLDGTKAFVRRQSHGVGTMLSLCTPEKFIAAYVGDVNTREIFGFRPNSRTVHRISEFNMSQKLLPGLLDIGGTYVELRDPAEKYSATTQRTVGMFRGQTVDGGSIGTWLARLWKSECSAAIINPSKETPWDANPINAISKRLGFVFMKPNRRGDGWVRYHAKPQTEIVDCEHDIMIVHGSNAHKFARV